MKDGELLVEGAEEENEEDIEFKGSNDVSLTEASIDNTLSESNGIDQNSDSLLSLEDIESSSVPSMKNVVTEKGKSLTRKQKKELEYKQKRDELIKLGIVPE